MFKTIVYTGIVAILFFSYIKYLERYFVFFPDKDINFTPESINLAYEDVYVETEDDIKINGWFIPYADAKYTVFFCHGNAGNIADRLDKITLFHNMGVNIFIIDYRGYGRSQGSPSENGLYLDAKAGYDYLLSKRSIKPEYIVLFGESLGASIAINFGSQVKVAGLIAEGAFSNGRDMGKKLYPFLPPLLFSKKFDSLKKIKAINAPKLFIHSRSDEIVPFALAWKLYSVAEEPKQFIEIKGSHNTAFLDSKELFISSIKAFIGGLLLKKGK